MLRASARACKTETLRFHSRDDEFTVLAILLARRGDRSVNYRSAGSGGEAGSLRQDPDDRSLFTFNMDNGSNRVWVRSQALPPEIVADDRDWGSAVRGRQTTQRRVDIQRTEETGCDLNHKRPAVPLGCSYWLDHSCVSRDRSEGSTVPSKVFNLLPGETTMHF